MELKIFSPQENEALQEVKWNYEEIKAEVTERLEHYRGLTFTENEVTEAKQARADLNRFIKALEDRRIELKKTCLKPYETFEAQVKEIVALINEPVALIDKQIKGYEDKEKAEKRSQIEELFKEMVFPEFVALDVIFDQKWLNKTKSLNSIGIDLGDIKERIERNIKTIEGLPEFSFEAMEVYKQTLNLDRAIEEGQRLADIQKRKEEAARIEAERQQAQEAASQPESGEEPIAPEDLPFGENNPPKAVESTPSGQWISFRAFLTVDQAKELKAFFDTRGIKFEAI